MYFKLYKACCECDFPRHLTRLPKLNSQRNDLTLITYQNKNELSLTVSYNLRPPSSRPPAPPTVPNAAPLIPNVN